MNNLNNSEKLDSILFQIPSNYMSHTKASIEAQQGLYYIAEHANNNGFYVRVKYVDPAFACISVMFQLISGANCRIVGFYVDDENIWILRRIIPELKLLLPCVHFIIGGPQVTGAPELTLQRIPSVTCGIIGYGEVPFLKLLQLNNITTDSISNIEALVYYDENNNIIKKDTIEYDLNEFKFPKRKEITMDPDVMSFSHIITGRGCVGRCAFCYEGSKIHNKPKQRSLESCFDELDYLTTNFPNQKYFSIVDDTFILNKERTLLFCKTIKTRYKNSFKWFCEGRVDIIDNIIDILPIMQDSGLVRIQLGGESGCQEILDKYNKNTTIEQIRRVTKAIVDANISSVYINFIIGGAMETEDTFIKTLSFAKELIDLGPGVVEVGASLFSPSPGSPMYNFPEKYGIKIIDKELITGADHASVFVETSELTKFRIRQLKMFFDNEITKYMSDKLLQIPEDRIIMNFENELKFDLCTNWKVLLSKLENFDNYYTNLVSDSYSKFINIEDKDLLLSIPIRTTQPVSDGVQNLRMSRCGNYIPNNRFEDAVISLSAGKLNFSEIYNILLSQKIIDKDTGYNKLCDLYEELDKELNIVWRNKF